MSQMHERESLFPVPIEHVQSHQGFVKESDFVQHLKAKVSTPLSADLGRGVKMYWRRRPEEGEQNRQEYSHAIRLDAVKGEVEKIRERFKETGELELEDIELFSLGKTITVPREALIEVKALFEDITENPWLYTRQMGMLDFAGNTSYGWGFLYPGPDRSNRLFHVHLMYLQFLQNLGDTNAAISDKEFVNSVMTFYEISLLTRGMHIVRELSPEESQLFGEMDSACEQIIEEAGMQDLYWSVDFENSLGAIKRDEYRAKDAAEWRERNSLWGRVKHRIQTLGDNFSRTFKSK